MNPVLAELRALRARTGIRQVAIAGRMKMEQKALSEVLIGTRRLTDDFEPRFRAAVAELAQEAAAQERESAETRARAMLEAAGVFTEEVAA